MAAQQLPSPRRVVTGHDEQGRAIYVADATAAPTSVGDGSISFAVLYETHEFPADVAEWKDPMLARTQSLANRDGVVLRVVDFQPNNRGLFYRTESLDFGIINRGEIICRLDDGVEKTFRAGDICVQRGTIHSWENRSSEVCRVTFVLKKVFFLAAKTVNGLETAGFNPEEMATGGPSNENDSN